MILAAERFTYLFLKALIFSWLLESPLLLNTAVLVILYKKRSEQICIDRLSSGCGSSEREDNPRFEK